MVDVKEKVGGDVAELLKGEGSSSRREISRKFRSLYVQTAYSLYEIDLNFPIEEEEWMLPFYDKGIPIEPKVDFVKSRLPIGMGILKIEPKSEWENARVFMIGGQMWTEEDEPLHPDHGLDPVNAIEFIPQSNEFKPADSKIVPMMYAPKARPLVVQFQNKIFVHDQDAIFKQVMRQDPTFEYLDLASRIRSWNQLVDCIMDNPLPLFAGTLSYVVDCRVFIISGDELFCFNLSSEKWESGTAAEVVDSFAPLGAYAPFSGTCVTRFDGENNVVFFLEHTSWFQFPTAFAVLLNDSGCFLLQQELPEFDDYIKISHIELFKFLDLEEEDEEGAHKMCGVIYGTDREPGVNAGIEVVYFTIKHSPTDDGKFVDCKIKGSKYHVSYETKDFQPLHLNAFLV